MDAYTTNEPIYALATAYAPSAIAIVRLSGDGVIVLGVVVDLKNKMIVGGPDVQTRGLFFVKDSEAILKEVTKLFINIIENELENEYFNKTHCENEVRDIIFKAIRRNAQKSPLIIPLIATI